MLAKVSQLVLCANLQCTNANLAKLDFLAHSNYLELALIEMGERDVFPHVGRNTLVRIEGARNEVYPCVTGTFGGVDFLHSVTGEGMCHLTGLSRFSADSQY